MNIISVFKKFETNEQCIAHLERVRWKHGVKCAYCDSFHVTACPKEQRHHCNKCNKTFSVTVGTIFHHTHLPLKTWFLALALMLNAKKGLSARQLARDLEINKNTAWRITMKIREAMEYDGELLTGIVEVDEVFIGGKPRKRNEHKKNAAYRKPKSPILGAVSRESGQVITQVLSKEASIDADLLNGFIKRNVNIDKTSVLLTDEYSGYSSVSKFLSHLTVNHSERFEGEDGVNTNTIEGFWAIVKRGIVGQYHKVSEYYLPRYLNEFSFRYNHRKIEMEAVFDKVIMKGLSSQV